MIKKLICFVLVIATCCAFFCVPAEAALVNSKTWVEQTFTRPANEVGNEAWTPDNWEIAGRTAAGGWDEQNKGIYRVTEDGAVELSQGTYVGYASITYMAPSLPQNFVFMFDIKFPASGNGLMMCSLNNFCQGVYGTGMVPYRSETDSNTNYDAGSHAADTWYTYMYKVNGDRMSVYRKAAGDADYTKLLDNVKMVPRTGNEIWGNISSGDDRMFVDNIKVFSGKTLINKEITFNESKTQATGTLTVRNGDVAPDATETAMLVMVAFDKKGKILNMESAPGRAVPFGDNVIAPIQMDCSGYYDKLVGGTVELYIWTGDGLYRPLVEPYAVNVTDN